jgi:UDP-N-acetylglucosamine 2-epimerase (non-hydrolysing)
MKAAPVVAALDARGAKPILVHTGQHYDEAMSDIFFRQLGMPQPDANLGVGSGSHARQTAALMIAIEDLLEEVGPKRLVVYGDINSTLAAAVVASKLHIPVAHVEAGLRSFDREMPEEINRVVTDALSDIHFTTSSEAAAHLEREGVNSQGIHFVGNPMIDTLLRFRGTLDLEATRQRFRLPERYAVATLHRPSNVDVEPAASNVVEGLRRVASQIRIVLPLHPRGRENLESKGLMSVPGIDVVDPIGYVDFMALLSGAALVMTDSGGIQEETTVLGVPCLTLRANTERPITVTMGTNRIVGNDPDRMEAAALEFLDVPPEGKIPPLWDGRAGDRIASILVDDRPPS